MTTNNQSASSFNIAPVNISAPLMTGVTLPLISMPPAAPQYITKCDIIPAYVPPTLKTVHAEWTMIREQQLSTIPIIWWNKVIESIIGYSLDNSSIPVPSLQYQLYDQLNGTCFRFGLKPGQAFVNGTYALNTILDDLYNPVNTFEPMDIGTFFQIYSFDTPANIAIALDGMYNNFNNININRIFFKILHDALASNPQYEGIMKTSMVSTNVTKPFVTSTV
jgi:hypothetical protein